MASAAVYAGGMGLVGNGHHQQAQGKEDRPAKAAPDAQPVVDAEAYDVYRHHPAKGYVPTYFDGHGGIAGVPLTEEQRQAVVKEALRRGVSPEDAHTLAYGVAEDSKPVVKPNVTPPAYGGTTVLAAGPVYREVAPTELNATGSDTAAPDKTPDREIPVPSETARPSTGRRDDEAKGEDKPKEMGTKEMLKRSFESVLPDPVEKPVEDLLGRLNPFRSYMFMISQPGTEPTFTAAEPEDGMVTVTAETQVTDSMAVKVEVTAPVEETADAPPSTVSVTVTDPLTDKVTVASETATVEGGHDDIPRVAIGEVVEAVVTAANDDSAAPGDSAAASEAAETAEGALESLPEPERPQPPAELSARRPEPEKAEQPAPSPEAVEPRPSAATS
ncbi:hypothetical protein LKL35_25975 [Streptomyces sp. ET3-23]|uniref:hypothetical protein n=1 Tax=Streptomyces sp. ET3-23 TaxID=2885643 RepID=UPI001D0FDF48|nr:hypothetical protein [Streptomyces sp. ET3-23]MCC2278849.1 hypothetical protein [Streptomyces sp. ET3-23]